MKLGRSATLRSDGVRKLPQKCGSVGVGAAVVALAEPEVERSRPAGARRRFRGARHGLVAVVREQRALGTPRLRVDACGSRAVALRRVLEERQARAPRGARACRGRARTRRTSTRTAPSRRSSGRPRRSRPSAAERRARESSKAPSNSARTRRRRRSFASLSRDLRARRALPISSRLKSGCARARRSSSARPSQKKPRVGLGMLGVLRPLEVEASERSAGRAPTACCGARSARAAAQRDAERPTRCRPRSRAPGRGSSRSSSPAAPRGSRRRRWLARARRVRREDPTERRGDAARAMRVRHRSSGGLLRGLAFIARTRLPWPPGARP